MNAQVEPVLQKSKLYDYKLKFSVDNFSSAFNNDILINRYEPLTGSSAHRAAEWRCIQWDDESICV